MHHRRRIVERERVDSVSARREPVRRVIFLALRRAPVSAEARELLSVLSSCLLPVYELVVAAPFRRELVPCRQRRLDVAGARARARPLARSLAYIRAQRRGAHSHGPDPRSATRVFT